jgi:hypothetical protein
MLAALWQIEPAEADPGRGFLAQILALMSAGEGERVLIVLTGAGGPPAEAFSVGGAEGLHVFVLQVGVRRPAPGWRDLCAGTGGVAFPMPPATTGRLAAADFVASLRAPALQRAGVELSGAGRAWLFPARGVFANQPLAAVVAVPAQAGASGRFVAKSDGELMQRPFALEPDEPVLRGEEARRAIDCLADATAEPTGPGRPSGAEDM